MRRLATVLALLCASSALAQVYTIRDEATPLTRRSTVVFTGSGIACVDTATSAVTTCTVPSGITDPVVIYETNVTQSMTSSAFTLVDFEDAVTASANVTTGASWKYTATQTETLQVCTSLALTVGAGTGFDVAPSLYKNGAEYARMDRVNGTNYSSGETGMNGCAFVSLVATDYINVYLYQYTGGSARNLSGQALSNRVYIQRVR